MKTRMYTSNTIVQELSALITAHNNCITSGNKVWEQRHAACIAEIMKRTAPSGAGIDSGTLLVRDRCTAEKLVFTFGFHHMNADGYYCGWTHYTAIVRPTFAGISVCVRGQNRNGILDYLHDCFYSWLRMPAPELKARELAP